MKNKIFFLLIALLLATSVFLRFWRLNDIPPGLQYDEAYNGINALYANETGDYKIFYPENNGREGLFINMIALAVEVFGTNNFAIHFCNALIGSLTIFGFFLLLGELKFSKLGQFIGAFAFAFSFWHLNFSRLSYRAIMVPFLVSWLLYFFFRGINLKEKISENKNLRLLTLFALSGFFFGVGFHTYIAFRVAPLFLFIIAGFLWLVTENFFAKYWPSILVFSFTALLVISPIALYFGSHMNDFSGRSNDVSVFNAPNNESFTSAFSRSLVLHLGAFFYKGDANQRHNYESMPEIPTVWGILFFIGFVISLYEIFSAFKNRFRNLPIDREKLWPAVVGQAVFWAMLIPGVMSVEGIPHALRIIGAMPGVFLLVALPFEYFEELKGKIFDSPSKNFKPLRIKAFDFSFYGLIFVMVVSGFFQVYLYFAIWAKDAKTFAAFEREFFDLGKLIAQTETKKNNYLVTAEEIAVSGDNKESSLKTVEYIAQPNIKNYLFYHPIDALAKIDCKNSQIVFQKADDWLRDKFAQKCPGLKLENLRAQNGLYSFWVMR